MCTTFASLTFSSSIYNLTTATQELDLCRKNNFNVLICPVFSVRKEVVYSENKM